MKVSGLADEVICLSYSILIEQGCVGVAGVIWAYDLKMLELFLEEADRLC